MKMKLFRKEAGFSMVDLIISSVILVVLIGASITYMQVGSQLKKARDARRKSDLGQYRVGLETYATVNEGAYPLQAASVEADSVLCADLGNLLDSCPSDPKDQAPYLYYYQSSADSYSAVLYGGLEGGDYWTICTTGKSGEVSSVAEAITYCGL
ncbi:type IV pilin protein [Patescibacteria group bacterium]